MGLKTINEDLSAFISTLCLKKVSFVILLLLLGQMLTDLIIL